MPARDTSLFERFARMAFERFARMAFERFAPMAALTRGSRQ
jgi:hypothetical protein